MSRIVASGMEPHVRASEDTIDIEQLLRHDAWLRGLVRELIGGDRADDVVQDTWVAVLRNPPRAEGAVRAWLAQVARNFARKHLRSQARRGHHETLAAPREDEADCGEVLERFEAGRSVSEAVAGLAEPYRSAVLLRYFEGRSVREVAQRTGTTEANVRQRVKRGLATVRHRLEQRRGRGWRHSPALVALAWPHGKTASVGARLLTIGTLALPIAMLVLAAMLAVHLLPSASPPNPDATASTASQDGATPAAQAAPANERELLSGAPAPSVPRNDERWLRRTGRVVDVEGFPVAGVEVQPVYDRTRTRWRTLGAELPPGATKAVTDSLGTFAIDVEARDGGLVVAAPWIALRVTPIGMDTADELLVVVARRTAISGRVVDEDANPVAGATVRGTLDPLLDYPAPLDATERIVLPPLQTDADGRFTWPAAAAGGWTFYVTSDGYAPASGHARTLPGEEMAIVMEPSQPTSPVPAQPSGASISGQIVTAAGQPMRGAQVIASDENGMRLCLVSADDRGCFVVAGLRAGRYRLDVMVLRQQLAFTGGVFEAGADEVRIAPPGDVFLYGFEGRVVDDLGQPVARVEIRQPVTAEPTPFGPPRTPLPSGLPVGSRYSSKGLEHEFLYCRTDADGRFRLPHVLRHRPLLLRGPGIVGARYEVSGEGVAEDLVVQRACYLSVDVRGIEGARSFELVDGDGTSRPLSVHAPNSSRIWLRPRLRAGRSGVLTADGSGAFVVVHGDDGELARIPVQLRPGEVTAVHR